MKQENTNAIDMIQKKKMKMMKKDETLLQQKHQQSDNQITRSVSLFVPLSSFFSTFVVSFLKTTT
jgi:hypothetical protein